MELQVTDISEETGVYQDADGWYVRDSDGEVLGREDASEAFHVHDDHSADWVLRLRSEIEGDRAGVLARKAAVNAMLDAELARIDGRLKWWDFRFRDQVVEYARRTLKGKDRTRRFTWGTVAFRHSKGTNRITDMAAAVEFVEAIHPQVVRVQKSVTVTDVVIALEAYPPGSEPVWLESTGPRETAVVSTGVGKG